MKIGTSLLDHPRRGLAAVALLPPFQKCLGGVMRTMVEPSDLDTVVVKQTAVNATVEHRKIVFSVKTSTNARLVRNNNQIISSRL
jgi:hypothetical protein